MMNIVASSYALHRLPWRVGCLFQHATLLAEGNKRVPSKIQNWRAHRMYECGLESLIGG